MNFQDKYATWLEIDSQAIRQNVEQMRSLNSDCKIMAVVKANGYGHGAVSTARAALLGGASCCGVARFEEALQLRQAGIDCPIMILGYTPPESIALAISQGISLAVWDARQVERCASEARSTGQPARLHLKVDTGMNRIGVRPESALELAQHISMTTDVQLEGIYTHYARADEANPGFTDLQEARFVSVLAQLRAVGLQPQWIHAANSAAGLARQVQGTNLVRMGVSLYGLHPSGERMLLPGFRPALTWKTVISHVKTVPAGEGISYNHEYVTTQAELIGTIPVGYADGFRRKRPNEVLVRGVRVPVVGRVCMDQCMICLDAVPEARVGDEVVLIGKQGADELSAEDVGRRWGTINYDVVCGIAARVTRVYS